MPLFESGSSCCGAGHCIRFAVALVMLLIASLATAQDVPLISGAVGFFTDTDAGKTSHVPIISTVLSAPIYARRPLWICAAQQINQLFDLRRLCIAYDKKPQPMGRRPC